MSDSIAALRETLDTRQTTLSTLRDKVQAAKREAAKPAVKSSISAIQQRYMAAVADLESKGKEPSRPAVTVKSDAVSSLANRWNKGMEGKEVEKTRVDVRGDVRGVKQQFGKADVPKLGAAARSRASIGSGARDFGPAELEIVDDDGLPSWAVNQKKKVIRKENARSSVRDVDLGELKGSVLEMGKRDGSEASGEKVEGVAGGNVMRALAMWGKNAEEEGKEMKRKEEEEKERKEKEEKERKQREEEELRRKMDQAVEKFASLGLDDMGDEPEDEVELVAYLERKIKLVEDEVERMEKELDEVEATIANQ
eukprot:GFKZ01003390.1.p2 GENE.GFKZ01003390.1~~GFKZ01003390.1.p2  ORF type:complete len:325 (+),score=114.82 GFKZ01003390.1:47-976(+)